MLLIWVMGLMKGIISLYTVHDLCDDVYAWRYDWPECTCTLKDTIRSGQVYLSYHISLNTSRGYYSFNVSQNAGTI